MPSILWPQFLNCDDLLLLSFFMSLLIESLWVWLYWGLGKQKKSMRQTSIMEITVSVSTIIIGEHGDERHGKISDAVLDDSMHSMSKLMFFI